MTLYSIGHSNYSQEDFTASIRGKISTVIDVRSHPESRWAQYERLQMQEWLPEAGIGYEWWPELGGWDRRHEKLADQFEPRGVDLHVYAKGKFPKQRIGKNFPDAVEASQLHLPHIRPKWTNVGLYDFSYFMTLPEFLSGMDRLIERSKTEDLGFLCCEAVYWRCHRSMISDYLIFRGVEAFHLMPRYRQKNKVRFVDGFRLTPHSQKIDNRLDRYEPEIIKAWKAWGSASFPEAVGTSG